METCENCKHYQAWKIYIKSRRIDPDGQCNNGEATLGARLPVKRTSSCKYFERK